MSLNPYESSSATWKIDELSMNSHPKQSPEYPI